MRKRRGPARKREDDDRSGRATQPGRDQGTDETEAGLEDDGLVFWPTSLGEPEGPRLVQVERRRPREPEKKAPPRRRMATTVLFTFLFFTGAALTAAAGNEVATMVSSSSETAAVEPQTTDTSATDTATTATTTATTAATDATATESTTTATTTAADPAATTTTAAPANDQPAGNGAAAPQVTTTTAASAPASPPATGATTSTVSNGSQNAPGADAASKPETTPTQVLGPQPATKSSGHKQTKRAKASYASLHKAPKPREVEPEGGGSGTTGNVHWINQPLPDPTPASLRLTSEFAQQLRAASSAQGLNWAFLLAVLRAERLNGSGQVSHSLLQRKAAVLGPLHVLVGDRKAVRAYNSNGLFSRRVLVLEHYYQALGLETLVKGLSASRDFLAAKILADQRIEIYPGGREDISSGRVDVRVLAMIEFLAESFGDVRVSCLITGHRLYARPGVISAHIYGRAVDIGALDGVSILGHQQQASVTARAVKQILLLPAEVLPRQVISLLGFGGPSFPLADHYNHIHIGY